jgi:VWFA-related protein
MRLSRRSLLLALAARAWAQEDAKFSTDVNVVTLLATVRDRQGRLVKQLTRDDFVLQENGVPQTIAYFSHESDLPLTIGLLVDTSVSQKEVLERERSASYTFLDQVLREGADQAFVVRFDRKVEVLQGFTTSRLQLAAALAQLKIPAIIGTLLYDAIRQSSETLMQRKHGRKAFILLSDGVDYRSGTSIGTAIEFAQRADCIVYSILFGGHPRPYQPVRAAIHAVTAERGRKAMQRLALETGGAFFEVAKDDPIENIYQRIEDALRNQYSIGYTPQPGGVGGTYQRIRLTAKQPDLIVQTRDGYYPR